METQIKKLIELAKEISEFAVSINQPNEHYRYSDNVRVYLADLGETRSVEYDGASVDIMLYSNRIAFKFSHTAESMEEVYNKAVTTFNKMKADKVLQTKFVSEKIKRIELLKKELEILNAATL